MDILIHQHVKALQELWREYHASGIHLESTYNRILYLQKQLAIAIERDSRVVAATRKT
jgi:hypothetical protein